MNATQRNPSRPASCKSEPRPRRVPEILLEIAYHLHATRIVAPPPSARKR